MAVDDPVILLAFAFLSLVPLSVLCLSYAIRVDANARGANGTGWGVLAFVALPVVGPIYAVYRLRLPARATAPGRLERRAGAVGIGVPAAYVASFLFAPPDPFTTILVAAPLVLVFVPAAFLLWYAPG